MTATPVLSCLRAWLSVVARLPLHPALLLAWWMAAACSRDDRPPYRDPGLPVEQRVRDLLDRMTLEEKFWQLFMVSDALEGGIEKYRHGIFGLQVRPEKTSDLAAKSPGYDATGAAREMAERINGIQRFFVEQTRLGIPIIPFDEALHGLVQDGATAFPQAIALAATWDTGLVAAVAGAIARETRSRGIRQVLSPVLNIASDVRWGRVEETYGEDPYLTTLMGLAFIRPLESAGIVTTPKHFVANVGDGGRDSYPIHWNERFLEEVHFPPFKAAVQAGQARSVMAAYNSVDGSPATASRWLLTRKLKEEWGFPGVVIADAGATGGANVLHFTAPDYATAAKQALEAGLDVLFQTSADHAALFWPAFEQGMIAPRTIDEAVARVLRVKFQLGLFENPYEDLETAARSASLPEHRALALVAARASIVLLKNQGGALPLSRSLRAVAVIGADAVEARLGGYSGPGNSKVSMLDGIREKLGPTATVRYEAGPGRGDREYVSIPSLNLVSEAGKARTPGLRGEYFDNIHLSGEPRVTRSDDAVDFGWTLSSPDPTLPFDWYSVRWTGQLIAPETGTVRIGVEGNDGYRLFLDGSLLIDNWRKQSYGTVVKEVRLERGKEYALRLEYFENTGRGRVKLIWNHGAVKDRRANIARAVALAMNSEMTIIVVGIEEGEFRDRASLRLPGHQEELIRAVAATGRPVVVVLVAGSAVTMTEWIDQVGAVVLGWYPGEEGGHAVADVLFGDHNPSGRLPITFPVAEGQLPLTYLHKPTGRGDDYVDLTGRPLFPFGFGLSYSRFEYAELEITSTEITPGGTALVRCRVRNEGPFTGDEVVQLYLRDELASVARPVGQLAGFQRIRLRAGEEAVVTFALTADHLSVLDEGLRRRVEPGTFRVLVGASSADIRLRGILTVR